MKKYDAYKPSGIDWIGDIPNEWEIKKIKYNFEIYAGATPKTEKDNYWDGDIVWITPADYKTDDKIVLQGERNITIEGYNSCNTYIVPKGSLIFSKRAPIGTVALCGVELCTNQGCLSCVPQKVNSLYYYYIIIISICNELFDSLGSGATFKEISADTFANVKLPTPPISEQTAIANYLDAKCAKIDNVVAIQRKRIELLKELKQSIITHAVTKGLDKTAKMENSNIDWIGEIPEGWEIKKIKHNFEIYAGATPKTEKESFWDGDIVWITPADYKTNDKTVLQGGRNITIEGYNSCNTQLVPQGSLIFSKRAPIGTVALSGVELCTNQGCLSCVPKNVNSLYYYYVISICTEFFDMLGSGATFKEISADTFANVKIPTPPLSEQTAIADYLDKKCAIIDKQIAKVEKQIDLLNEYKQSVITECVTGKRKVC